ncbi:MAG TPA: hypothetical protein VKB93_17505 [Thermoanaerobaculia bacterium]|nr:hypothetical protein [Thermoanaerobaculia bacterium]
MRTTISGGDAKPVAFVVRDQNLNRSDPLGELLLGDAAFLVQTRDAFAE